MSFNLHTNTSTWGFPCSFFISNALSFTALQRSASLSDLDQDYVQGAQLTPTTHNYRTGLNIPPTRYSIHQRPSILSPTLVPCDAFLSPLLLYLIHTLCLSASSTRVRWYEIRASISWDRKDNKMASLSVRKCMLNLYVLFLQNKYNKCAKSWQDRVR